jgi:hypothetical protein
MRCLLRPWMSVAGLQTAPFAAGAQSVTENIMPVSARSRLAARAARLCGCVLMLALLPVVAAADPLPASLRACAAETDANKRLACFDREVARFSTPTASPTAATGPAAGPGAARAPSAAVAATPVIAPNPAPAAKPQDLFGLSLEQIQPKAPSRLTAHVVGVTYAGNAMVVHLDNGQVWMEVPEGSATTKLKSDDTVTIDKGVMGAYWLRGPGPGVIKVKRKQ